MDRKSPPAAASTDIRHRAGASAGPAGGAPPVSPLGGPSILSWNTASKRDAADAPRGTPAVAETRRP